MSRFACSSVAGAPRLLAASFATDAEWVDVLDAMGTTASIDALRRHSMAAPDPTSSTAAFLRGFLALNHDDIGAAA
jgi:hypothetical protein